MKEDLFRRIPAVHELVAHLRKECGEAPEGLLARVAREAADTLRREIHRGERQSLAPEEAFALARRLLEARLAPSLRPVINATGVVVHTNLGRSLLPREAVEAVEEVARRYSNLEFDLASGRRGSRYSHVEEILCELTGAEAALVVNNNAAAVLLTLNTLALGREVIVSRGELVEIGGSFRIPDVMARSGAILREVGATNRTHLRDYEEAIGEETALLMKVHRSNFALVGFTKEVSSRELVELGQRHGLPVVEDLGSGCFVDLARHGLGREPTVQEVLSAGVSVVTFSGDKLLGGPQAGIILGQRDLLARIKKNPMNRAVRIDKMTLAALEATLRLYRDEDEALRRIPTLAMLTAAPEEILRRARALRRRLRPAPGTRFRIVETVSRVGGGALPLASPRSYALAVESDRLSPAALERRLRAHDPPVVGRIEDERLLLDLRTVLPEEVPVLARALNDVLAGEEGACPR